jgi:hypothetical protein
MAMQDLYTALQMFGDGVNQLQTQRAITGANEQVQQIRASEASEQEKRAAMQQISNNLVSHLAGMGTPATTLQAVAGAIGPKQFANANQMNEEALLTGNSVLGGLAKQQQDFENNKAFELARIKASRSPADNMLAQMKFEEAKDQFNTKEFAKLSKTLDPSAEVRSSFGRGAQGLQQAGKIQGIIGNAASDPSKLDKLSPVEITELAAGISQMVKNGVATEGELKAFIPHTSGDVMASVKQYLTNAPAAANKAGFVQLYQKFLDRERAELTTQQEDAILNRAQGNFKLYKRDPELFKQTVAQRLGVNADDIVVDDKKRTITTKDLQQKTQDSEMAISNLKQAYAAMKSGDPSKQQQAMQVFKALKVDAKMPYNVNAEKVKYFIRRGQL